jgi:hypothetical protein
MLAQIAPEADTDDEDDAFAMTNLRPRRTGLPMTVYVSLQPGSKHDVRVKVSTVHGQTLDPSRTAVVSVRPEPKLIHGELTGRDLELVKRWIELNRDLLIAHWEARLDSEDMFEQVRSL